MTRSVQNPKELANRKKTFLGAAVMGFFMLVSRCLGLLRDINTAAVMGLSGSAVMDAFVCAFRIPNIVRRFLEEGVFGLTFIPVFSQTMKSDPRRAWRLAARYLWYGTILGLCLTLLFELTAGLGLFVFKPAKESLWWNVCLFGAVIFPYFTFVIPAAQCTATLQGLGRFSLAGLMPVLFNLFWLTALFLISPFGIYLPFKVPACGLTLGGISPAQLSPAMKGTVLCATIAAVSAVQFLIQYLWLLRLGAASFLFGPKDQLDSAIRREIKSTVRGVFRRLIPATIGVFFLQLNMLLATLAALLFSGVSVPLLSAIPGFNSLFAGTTGRGAASALYFGERLYEFPLALVGITLSTAFYPLLARRWFEKDARQYGEDLTIGIRLVSILAIPSGIGLAMMSAPAARLFFAHGAASPEDSARIARLTFCFAAGVPAFCLAAFLNRASLAAGNLKDPLQAGLRSTAVFLLFALVSVRHYGELGLATAVSAGSWAQVFFFFRQIFPHLTSPQLTSLSGTIWRTVAASAVMAGVIAAERWATAQISFFSGLESTQVFAQIALDLAAGIGTFGIIFLLFGRGETSLLKKLREKEG